MRVLISGAGIAGPTLAYWLLRHGFQPTLVEEAPRLRTSGYVIDFWGLGFDVARKMGIVPELLRTGYLVEEVKLVNRTGSRAGGFSVKVLSEMTQGRYVSLPRGDLAASIYRALNDKVETMFGERIVGITEGQSCVRVAFERSSPRDFELVVGADGLHSSVRRLVFGEEACFEKYLGYQVAAFEIPGYRPRDELAYVSYSLPGRQIARFALRDDRTLILLLFADDELAPTRDLAARGETGSAAHKRELHARFDDAGWECPQILAAMDKRESLYMDRVSQIHVQAWSAGRVALIGDAAACPSLLAGQGSALAMIEAYVLAGELRRAHGEHRRAFAAYEARLRPFIESKQKAATQFASSFAPRTETGIFLRNLVTRAMKIAWVAKLAIGRNLLDDLALPDYEGDRL